MTDIVDRLRELEITVCHEAADEIDLQRERVAFMKRRLDKAVEYLLLVGRQIGRAQGT